MRFVERDDGLRAKQPEAKDDQSCPNKMELSLGLPSLESWGSVSGKSVSSRLSWARRLHTEPGPFRVRSSCALVFGKRPWRAGPGVSGFSIWPQIEQDCDRFGHLNGWA
jgi:hypothetical protein